MSKNTDEVKANYKGYSKYSENYQRDLLTAQEKDAAANANRAPRERDPEIDSKFDNCLSQCLGDSDSGVFIKLCHFKNHLPNFSLSGK